ncbi:MAG: sigma 54-interacting transcriptional regulator [Planctomycetes bacterium]|nr:sigma 54-interacting transcriptional regulator [Planctomycetota bacterium]
MTAGLWVRTGSSRGYWFVLPADEVVLGRDLDVELPISDAEVSRRHAVIAPAAGERYAVRDLGSRNGTRVNGIPEAERVLEEGDLLQLGRTQFVFRARLPALRAGDAVELAPRRSTLASPGLVPAPGPPAAPAASAPASSAVTPPAAAAATPGDTRARAAPDDDRPGDPAAPPEILGEAPALLEVFAWIRRAAPVDSPVLLRGETGTGKELAARAIHGASPRRRRPFVALNCAAVPPDLFESELFGHARGAFTGAFTGKKGLVEMAEGGTLFLDEIGECPLAAQAKLLRVLDAREVLPVGAEQPRRVDFRLLAATHRDLSAAIEAGGFRSDLYFRIKVLEIVLPPLRERPQDIPLLADRFLEEFRRLNPAVHAFAPAALDLLRRYAWPGNVRELKNAIERAVLVAAGPRIEPEDFPLELRAGLSSPEAAGGTGTCGAAAETLLRDVERRHILRVLRLAEGNKTKAAALLGVDRGTLYNKLREFGL